MKEKEMAFLSLHQQPSACFLKLRGRESKRVISLATKYLRKPNNYDNKYCMLSSRITKLNSCLRFKSVTVSALDGIIPPTTPNIEDFPRNLEIDSETKVWATREKLPLLEKVENTEMEVNSGLAKVSWVDCYLPKKIQPYARLARVDKPIVTWLFVWPSFWAIALATSPGSLPNAKLMALFGISSIFIRGYGCTINDIFDRDVDKKVHRSKQRPIASGVVTPLQGVIFLFLQLIAILALLHPVKNNCSTLMGYPMFPLYSTYPLMKRLTYWPQAYLGIAISWITIVAWSAVKGSIDLAVLVPLFVSLVTWTLSYDTIYAHQDRTDDVKAGVKSTAVLFGDSTKMWCTFFSIICIGCLAISGFNAKIGWPFYASLVAGSGHLAWQIITIDLSNPNDCKTKFISNIWFGAIIFIGTCLGRLLN